jgi:hypothetical protein
MSIRGLDPEAGSRSGPLPMRAPCAWLWGNGGVELVGLFIDFHLHRCNWYVTAVKMTNLSFLAGCLHTK